MTLTLELPSEPEGVLREEARRQGTTPERLAVDGLRRLFAPKTPDASPNTASVSPTMALFAAWAAEDRTDDPDEIACRQREGDELMGALRENRMKLAGRTDFAKLLGDDVETDAERRVDRVDS